MTIDRRDLILAALAIAGVLLALAALNGCGDVPAPRADAVPAEVEAADLGARLTAERTAAAEAAAQAASLERRAAGTTDPAKAADLRLEAERARLRAEAATAKAAALADLRAQAQDRIAAERREIDARAELAAKAAGEREAQADRDRDRRLAGWGVALAAVVAVGLRLAGLPWAVAGLLPAAAAAGCLVLAAWSSVPWLAVVLGWALAAVVLVGGGYVLARVVREWIAHSQDAASLGKDAADAASLARQPRWLRWILDHLIRSAS